MRVSSAQMYDTSMRALTTQQSALLKANQQVVAQRSLLSPADDPVAAAQELALTTSLRASEQMMRNQSALTGQLVSTESYLDQGVKVLQAIQSRLVQAGSGILNEADRKSILADLSSSRDQLLALANTQDESGNYVFAGYKTDTQPFTRTAAGVQYAGDTGVRQVQISPNRFIDANFSGAYLFANVPTGKNGVDASAGTGNTGSALLTNSSIVDKTQWSAASASGPFQVTFGADGAYAVTDAEGAEYATGELGDASSIDVAGVRLAFSGRPADGDTLSVGAPTTDSIFDTLDSIIASLNLPPSSQESTQRANALFSLGANVAAAADRLGEARSTLGSRQVEVDAATDYDSARKVSLSNEIAMVTGADASSQTEAISELARRKTSVEAAQLTYTQISQLSIFNFLR